jgi:hypothetical protein
MRSHTIGYVGVLPVDILTKPLSRHWFHQITNAILFSHHTHTITIQITLAPTAAAIPVTPLDMRMGYNSDHGLEAYDSDLADEPEAVLAEVPQHVLENDLDIELETVISTVISTHL